MDKRDPRRRGRGSLGLVALLVLVLLVGCGGPRGVSLTELAVNADYYDGREVVASGIVLEFDGDEVERHFVLQDAEVNRVELVPADVAAPHVGSAVEVVGEFEFDENRGRAIHIDTIEAVGSGR